MTMPNIADLLTTFGKHVNALADRAVDLQCPPALALCGRLRGIKCSLDNIYATGQPEALLVLEQELTKINQELEDGKHGNFQTEGRKPDRQDREGGRTAGRNNPAD
jgi:hypothetical protein